MNEYRFTAEVARQARDVSVAKELWSAATVSLREWRYPTPGGIIRVRADWRPLASDDDIVHIDVSVIDEDGHLAPRDIASFVELFFHDAFLLFNIAVPGSFGGAITVSGGEYRVNELAFDASPFAAGMSTVVPLADVVAWYHGGTEQVATSPMQRVLFHLLHIACDEGDQWMLAIRLAACQQLLGISEPLLDVADVALLHPMHDEALDERLDDDAPDLIDEAMVSVLTAIQEAVRA
jgi:hypothetical protein